MATNESGTAQTMSSPFESFSIHRMLPSFALDETAVQATVEAWQWLPQLTFPKDSECPPARCSHAACVLSSTEFVIVGGGVCDASVVSADGEPIWRHFNDIWLFDSLEVSWRRLDLPSQVPTTKGLDHQNDLPPPPPPASDAGSVPVARRGHGAAYYAKRREIIIFGGTQGGINDGIEQLLNDVWVFSLETRRWRRPSIGSVEASELGGGAETVSRRNANASVSSSSMQQPCPRRGCASFLVDDGFFVIGGFTRHADGFFDSQIWRLDLVTWQWETQAHNTEYMIRQASGEELRLQNLLGLPTRRLEMFALSTAAVIGRDVWFFGGSVPMLQRGDVPISNVMRRLRCPAIVQPTGGSAPGSDDGICSSSNGPDTPASFVWTFFEPCDRYPAPRFCHGLAAMNGGLSSGALHRLLQFDDAAANQEAISSLSSSRSLDFAKLPTLASAHAPSTPARYLLLFGGTGDARTFDDVHLFDTRSFTWKQLLSNSEADAHSGGDTGSHGANISRTSNRMCEQSDVLPVSTKRPSPRNAFSMVAQGNKVVVFGGGIYPSAYFDSTFAFDLNLPLEPPPTKPLAAPFHRIIACGTNYSKNEGSKTEEEEEEEENNSSICVSWESFDLTLLPGPMPPTPPSEGPLPEPHDPSPVHGSPCHVHRRVLVARCPYFRSMLGDDGAAQRKAAFAEAAMDTISLPDIPEGTLKVLLYYLYTGDLAFHVAHQDLGVALAEACRAASSDLGPGSIIEATQQNMMPEATRLRDDGYEAAQHLMHMSSLWALDHLKRLIEDAILRDLGGAVPAALAVPMFSLSDALSAPKLRLFAMHAIVRNWTAVRASDNFQELPLQLQEEAEWFASSLLL